MMIVYQSIFSYVTYLNNHHQPFLPTSTHLPPLTAHFKHPPSIPYLPLPCPFVVSMCWGDGGAFCESLSFYSSSFCHGSCRCHRHAGSVWLCWWYIFFCGCWMLWMFYCWLESDLPPFLLKVVSILNQSLPETTLLKLPCSSASANDTALPVSIFTLAVLESVLASICPLFLRHPTPASIPPFPVSFFHPSSAPLFCPHEYFRCNGQILASVELI